MVQLYIDDGVPNRGHRTNMVENPRFTMVGIAYCKHNSSYGNMIVVKYAGGFVPNAAGERALAQRAKN